MASTLLSTDFKIELKIFNIEIKIIFDVIKNNHDKNQNYLFRTLIISKRTLLTLLYLGIFNDTL